MTSKSNGLSDSLEKMKSKSFYIFIKFHQTRSFFK
jgi:hypothetical protein